MKWLELSLAVKSEAVEAIAEVFHRLGRGGVALEESLVPSPDGEGLLPDLTQPVTVRTYLPLDRSTARRKRLLREALGHLSLIVPLPPLQERELAEEDWAEAWKAHFEVHRVGRRLVIKPSWRDYTPKDKELVLELDPGMAFGTGLHPTTRLCLLQLEKYVCLGSTVLDLGTGSGILALAMARLGASRVVALDTDPVAVKAARANVRRNRLGRRIQVTRGTLPGGNPEPEVPILSLEPFHLVVANITARVLRQKAEGLAQALRPQGLLIASGLIAEQVAETVADFEAVRLTIEDIQAEEDWRTVVARAPTLV